MNLRKKLGALILASSLIIPSCAKTNKNLEFKLEDNQTIKFVKIPGGEFTNSEGKVEKMGSFFMAEKEINWSQYLEFIKETKYDASSSHNPRTLKRYFDGGQKDNNSIYDVSYNNAIDFCRWLSKKTKRNVTLPTENQWTYAYVNGKVGEVSLTPDVDLSTNMFGLIAMISGNEEICLSPGNRNWDNKQLERFGYNFPIEGIVTKGMPSYNPFHTRMIERNSRSPENEFAYGSLSFRPVINPE